MFLKLTLWGYGLQSPLKAKCLIKLLSLIISKFECNFSAHAYQSFESGRPILDSLQTLHVWFWDENPRRIGVGLYTNRYAFIYIALFSSYIGVWRNCIAIIKSYQSNLWNDSMKSTLRQGLPWLYWRVSDHAIMNSHWVEGSFLESSERSVFPYLTSISDIS